MNSQENAQIQELEKKLGLYRKLVEVNNKLTSTLPLDELLQYIMDAAADITGCESASVLLWNPNEKQLFFASTTSSTNLDIIGKKVPLEGSIAGTVMRERRIVEIVNVKDDPRHYNKFDDDNSFITRSLLAVPLVVRNRQMGVLEVVNKLHLPWTEDDRVFLSALASNAAAAIEDAQLVNALRRANDDLKELDKLKNDFIALASHELRTPLGVILGYASFLQADPTNDPQRTEQIEKVLESAMRLRKIIEDLINLRYLQQSAADLKQAPISLDRLLQDAHFDVMSLLDANSQQLRIGQVDPGWMVNVDRGRFSMALTNLLVNAVEFTPEHQEIRIDVEKHNNEAWIRVKDEGVGISHEQLDRIFAKFYQVENHMVRHHEGLGIGLSICQAVVEAHNGRIWAQSEGLGKGATFTIAIPLV